MTTLAFLCQIFLGLVALPRPSRWRPIFCKVRNRDADINVDRDTNRHEDNGTGNASFSNTHPDGGVTDDNKEAPRGRGNASPPSRPVSSSGSRSSLSSGGGRRPSSSSKERRDKWNWGSWRKGSRKGKSNAAGGTGLDAGMLRDIICDPV